MKCIVLLFYSAHYSTYSTRRRLILADSHWFRNFYSVQRASCNSQCSLNCLMQQQCTTALKNVKKKFKKSKNPI